MTRIYSFELTLKLIAAEIKNTAPTLADKLLEPIDKAPVNLGDLNSATFEVIVKAVQRIYNHIAEQGLEVWLPHQPTLSTCLV